MATFTLNEFIETQVANGNFEFRTEFLIEGNDYVNLPTEEEFTPNAIEDGEDIQVIEIVVRVVRKSACE